jgi:dihydrofolate reductase
LLKKVPFCTMAEFVTEFSKPRVFVVTVKFIAIDTIVWGRKTYDWVLSYHKKKGQKAGMFDTKVSNYVFSKKPPKRAAPGVEFVSEPVKAFARRLRATPGKHIWMMGGGELIASFLDAGRSTSSMFTSFLTSSVRVFR